MFGRQKGEQSLSGEPCVESLTTEIESLDEAVGKERQRLADAQAELGETNELRRRAELRETIAQAEETIADGEERLDHLRAVRDRLAIERELAKLDPLRESIAAGEREEEELRARLAAVSRTIAEAKADLSDREDAIVHPTLDASERAEVDWIVKQWMTGGVDVSGYLARMSRRLQKAARERMAAIAGGVPAAVEDHRRRARQTWKDADREQWEPLAPVDVPAVEVPEAKAPEPLFVKVG